MTLFTSMCKFQQISKSLNYKHVCNYNVKLLFSLSLTSVYSHLSHTFTKHILYFHSFIGGDSSTEILLQSTSYLSISLFLSCVLFWPQSPWANYYTATVTSMSLLCLKPNAPVCQRAQLCEDKWTHTLKCVNSQWALQKKEKADFSEW